MNPASGNRLRELDALRGIASLLVVAYHLTMGRPQSNAFWDIGIMAVDTFFIISGFVIFMTLENCLTGKEFLMKRIARLYPVFWICMTITMLVLIPYGFEHFNRQTAIKYLANLSLLHLYLGQPSMDGVYWSLVVELIFYLLMLLLLALKKLDKIEQVVAGSLLFLSGYGLYCQVHPLSQEANKHLYTQAAIVFILPDLLLGICLYQLRSKGPTVRRYLLIAGCFITAVCINGLDPRTGITGSLRFFTMLAALYGIFLLLIYGRLQFIVNPVTLFLGGISYPLYLLHMNISLLVLLPHLLLVMPFWYAVLADVLILVAAAYLIHILVEQPAHRWAQKRWPGRKKKLAAALQPQEPVSLQPTT